MYPIPRNTQEGSTEVKEASSMKALVLHATFVNLHLMHFNSAWSKNMHQGGLKLWVGLGPTRIIELLPCVRLSL